MPLKELLKARTSAGLLYTSSDPPTLASYRYDVGMSPLGLTTHRLQNGAGQRPAGNMEGAHHRYTLAEAARLCVYQF